MSGHSGRRTPTLFVPSAAPLLSTDFLQTCCKWPKNHRSLGNVSKGCGLLFLLFIDPHQAKPLLLTTRLMAAQLLSSTKGPWLAPLPFLIFLRPESYQHLSRDIISPSRPWPVKGQSLARLYCEQRPSGKYLYVVYAERGRRRGGQRSPTAKR